MITLEKFTASDWETLAGAVEFGGSIDPMITYDVTIDYLPTILVLHADGLQFNVLTEDAGEVVAIGTLEDWPAVARFLAAGISPAYDTGSLVDAGFTFQQS